MQFNYGDVTYRLEFQRNHKNVTITRCGREKTIVSKHPYTTAKLLQIEQGKLPTVVAKASVGCLPIDTFNIAKGREEALRALWRVLRKSGAKDDLGAALWEAYLNRGRRVEPTTEVTTPTLPALPPHVEPVAGSAQG